MTGLILHEGLSELDGSPIVLIATLRSENTKTGDMIQTWIIRSDMNPVTAINNGGDESVCGNCPLRGEIEGTNKKRGCYVAVQNAPNQIFRSYKNGNYPIYNKQIHKYLFMGRKMRLGSYGDPVAVPMGVWKPFIRLVKGHTGYTHQWKQKRFWRWRSYLMASTHTEFETMEANDRGWRAYRTKLEEDEILDSEIVCPASDEGGHRRTCETCMACYGCKNGQIRKNLVINVHGGKATKNAKNFLISLL